MSQDIPIGMLAEHPIPIHGMVSYPDVPWDALLGLESLILTIKHFYMYKVLGDSMLIEKHCYNSWGIKMQKTCI